MKTAIKNIIFYVIIAGEDKKDHLYLRKAMNKLVPQSIVESLYEPKEIINFFEKQSTAPHLILLDQDMINKGGKEMLNLIRTCTELKNIPVIVLTESKMHFTNDDLQRYGASEFYSKPYHKKAIDEIVNDLREKWFSSILNKKNAA